MGPTNFSEDADCGSFFDHIDDIIEFPSENECAGVGGILGPVGGDGKSFPSLWDEPLPGTGNLFAGNDHLPTDLSAELSVPYEDIVHLEWLSNFVEDSFTCAGMSFGKEHPIVKKEFPTNQYQTESFSSQFQMSSPVSVLESSSSSTSSSSSSGGKAILLSSTNQQRGAQRARSKRPRPATFNPRLVLQHLTLPPPAPFMPTGVSTEPENYAESEVANRFMNPPVAEESKKKKKKTKSAVPPPPSYNMEMDENQQSQPLRKCLHCEITKTPQWRAGPLGPKTLCNACGVRYKSGRLFPEYRPAASPTFVPAVHSNSHKKVLEMRGTVIVNEKEKDSVVGTAAKTYIPSQRDSVPVPVLAPAPAPVPVPTPFAVQPKLECISSSAAPAPVPAPTPFPAAAMKPKLEYM